MSLQDKQDEGELVREILGYFLKHPQSADSLEGVARWRLLDKVIRRSLDETSIALEWLVSEGYLEKTYVRGGDGIYSLNQQKRDEAERFLRQDEPPAPPDP